MVAIDDLRAWLADRLIAPRWYHPAFGVLAGALIAVAETRNRRRVGVAVKYCRSRVSVIIAAQVLTPSALVAVACWLDLDRERRGAFLVAGVLAVAITIVFGRWTDKALRADFQARR